MVYIGRQCCTVVAYNYIGVYYYCNRLRSTFYYNMIRRASPFIYGTGPHMRRRYQLRCLRSMCGRVKMRNAANV